MRIQCPQCGVKGSLDAAFSGKNVRCPRCSALFRAGKEQTPAEPEVFHAVETQAERTAQEEAAPQVSGGEERIDEESAGQSPQRREKAAAGLEDTGIPAAGKAWSGSAGMPPPLRDAGGTAGGSAAEAAPMPPLPEQGGDQDSSEFLLGRLISRAWDLTRGVKAPIWVGLLITYGVFVAFIAVRAALTAAFGEGEEGTLGMLTELLSSAVSTLFTAGLMFMGVKRAAGRGVVWKDIFSGFQIWAKILLAAILTMLLVITGFLLLILPGVYLLIGYLFTYPLMIEKQMSPWQAMETSRKAVHKVWWKILGLYLVVGLVCALSAIPFGIGLIWTMPLTVVLYGVVYKTLFGTEKAAE